jgi:pyruvate/2-oxoglutarate dehydrogenase complex dihydrolipoamide dehydrogenase (E3) component
MMKLANETNVLEQNIHAELEALPNDEHNAKRIANLHPESWKNPEPAEVYNLVVIGGGSAGLVTSIIAAGLGAKVALIEKHLMGGDCLNVGCVPSKALIRAAKAVGDINKAAQFGIETGGTQVNFAKVMERIRRVQADISPHDSVWRYTEEGVDVFLGAGHFTGPDTIEVAGESLKFKKAVISTGSRPYVPPIAGLIETGYLTNETLFNLTEQPRRLAVIGGGPIGAELAQAFQRLGTQVTLLHNSEHILNKEDADAAEIVQQTFKREGIELILNSNITEVSARYAEKIVHYQAPSGSGEVAVDEILMATGRMPNIEYLGLEHVDVKTDPKRGIIVNDQLQTSNPRIYAAGDVAMAHKFTHAASAAARLVIQNALFYGRKRLSDVHIPWTTYTDPEIAHVGLAPHHVEAQGIELDTFTVQFDENDRAVADGEEEGFVKIHTQKGTDKILGATIVARHAGEMINEITLAMEAGVGLKTIGNVIHPYPTQAEAIARAAGAYNRTRLTPTVEKLFSGWMSLNRRLMPA